MSERPVRICFPFTGDVVGGSHMSVLGLVRHLDPARFSPVIVPQFPFGAIASLFRANGVVTETPLQWTRLPYDEPVGLWAAAQVMKDVLPQIRYLRSGDFGIVHSNDGRTHATWALAARLSGAKLLWHQRGDPNATGLRFAAPILANQVVAVSAFASPAPGRWSAASRTRVVHSPFTTDAEEDRDEARAALIDEIGCDPDTVFIGFFGALIPRKRPHLFVDALAALTAKRLSRPVMGLVFGEAYDGGRSEAELSSYAHEAGLSGVVKLMGFRAPGPRWLAACDMLMVPAFGEPFGRTLIEAMLVGTPVVATASGGNVEALRGGELGMLVPPEDASALADAAAVLIDWPASARSIAAAARKDAQRRFGNELHASQIMSIYDEMLGGRAKRSAPASIHSTAIPNPVQAECEGVS